MPTFLDAEIVKNPKGVIPIQVDKIYDPIEFVYYTPVDPKLKPKYYGEFDDDDLDILLGKNKNISK